MALQRQRTPTTGQAKSRQRTPQQRQAATIDTNQLRKAVFTLTPTQLEAHYQELEAWEDGDAEILSAQELAEDDNQAELDNSDPDAIAPEDEVTRADEASAPLGATDGTEDSPTLTLDDLYRLCVVPGNATWTCQFAPPAWMRRRSRLPNDPLPALVNGLQTLAAWLQQDKQAFLRAPTAESFAQAPCGRLDAPAVLQNGLLATIQPPLLEEQWAFPKEQDLSDLKDKVWLLWPDACLPLTALFSKEFQTAWVLARCVEQFRLASWCDEVAALSSAELKQAQRIDPATWTMAQALACLSYTAIRQNPDAILEQLRQQAGCPHG
ncbi:hypothetical protein [Thiorhodovibrio frisius]|uniref:Uncharacterized protein n=1 Tax=Thiorhodovibrio frisius TaxID=631362 RepID=H8YVT0_9GAMM|nr:hypothetical protein [Thiorhodovibrio frisius]EIC24020.1 hypothetical protein Thi970DRAFT_00161 [Thiorhodovibrio frisius]WPL23094.1 hypothetical protein Thiofri_03276 [Thiorhodovibrio frisius]